MPVSPCLQQMLSSAGVNYQLISDQIGCDPEQCIQLVLLEDTQGPVQLLFPQSDLVDLNNLQTLLGRSLQRMAEERLHQLCAQHQLAPGALHMPLPQIPTLVERRLLDQPQLFPPGDSTEAPLLELTGEAFRKLIPGSTPLALTTPAPVLEAGPLDLAADESALSEAVSQKTDLKIRARLQDTLEIPPLQETARRIIRLRAEPEPEMQDLIGIVETDPCLAAQVVSWANSSYYGHRGPVKSIEDAVIRVLGFDLVINLALGLALGKALELPKEHPLGTTPYWRKAAYCATAMESLVRLIPAPQRPELGLAYLIGLLHNFGYLIMAHIFEPQFTRVCRYLEVNPHLPSPVIEQYLLGVSREQMSAWLMQSWEMPDELVVALRFQHLPDYRGPHARYAQLLALSNSLLAQHQIGEGPSHPLLPSLYGELGLEPLKAESAIQQLVENGESIDELSACFSSFS